jgi:hypothetical protein
MSSVLSREEKERILKALEEDREFRYALMGLLGYKEILDRITLLESRFAKLEERFADLEKRFADLEERFARLEERVTRLEERFAQLEERVAKLEERIIKLEERFADLEERFIKLEERFARLEERVLRVEEELAETRRVVIVIAHRFGVITEEAFRSAMKYILEEVFGVAKVSKWVYSDKEGLVYGRPSVVEVDVLVKDREHILVEVKSRVSKGDVAELSRIGVLYERIEGVKPRLVILGGFIDEGVYELARELGVEIRPIFKSTTQ